PDRLGNGRGRVADGRLDLGQPAGDGSHADGGGRCRRRRGRGRLDRRSGRRGRGGRHDLDGGRRRLGEPLRTVSRGTRGERQQQPDDGASHVGGRTRIKPSCTTDTTSCPSREKIFPSASPRASEADGLIWSYRNHSSARNGRWNHIA